MVSDQEEYLKTLKTASEKYNLEELGDKSIELLNVSSEFTSLLTIKDNTIMDKTWYNLNNKVLNNFIKSAIEFKSILINSKMSEKGIDRSFLIFLGDCCVISESIFTAISWNEIRKSKRPDVEQFISDEIVNSSEYKYISNLSKNTIEYNENSGPGTSRLIHSYCERDCTKCPIANSLATSTENLIFAEKYSCPMFSTRLSLLSDPIFSILSIQITNNIYSLGRLMSSQERIFDLLSKDFYYIKRLEAVKDFCDQFSSLNEDRLSLNSIITANKSAKKDLFTKEYLIPISFIGDIL